jgi:hypothetical protein
LNRLKLSLLRDSRTLYQPSTTLTLVVEDLKFVFIIKDLDLPLDKVVRIALIQLTRWVHKDPS